MAFIGKKRKGRIALLTVFVLLCLCALGILIAHKEDVDSFECYNCLTIESGDPWPQAADFLKNTDGLNVDEVFYVTDIAQMQTNKPGSYDVVLSYRDETANAIILVQDSVAPVGSVRDISLINPESITAEDLLVDCFDQTEVSVCLEFEPVLTETGTTEVVVILEDEGGNVTRLMSIVSVISDSQAPVIQGAKDLETYVEDTISYRSGITVEDDQDDAPVLTVDNSAVDLSTPGLYNLTYIATDHAGNSSSETVTIQVYPKKENYVEPEIIYEAADSLLAKIIRDDMTTREKVEAVYCWVWMHTDYVGYSEKDDWLQGAYQFLTTRRGDCYSFCALNKLLLQRLGIPTIDVEKVKNYEGDSRHYWLLVSIDGGETYYHLDNCQSPSLCLVTDAQLDSFSAMHRNCFNRDVSLYPTTPEENLPYSPLPWGDPILRNTTG